MCDNVLVFKKVTLHVFVLMFFVLFSRRLLCVCVIMFLFIRMLFCVCDNIFVFKNVTLCVCDNVFFKKVTLCVLIFLFSRRSYFLTSENIIESLFPGITVLFSPNGQVFFFFVFAKTP